MLSRKAMDTIRETARRSGDSRLYALARLAAEPEVESVKGRFDPVIKAIDKMVAQLQDEENEDLEIKETWEKDRMENTRKAILSSREIDEQTDKITKLTEVIAQCKQTIKELEEEIAKTHAALKEATRMREDEHAAWKITDKDDTEAAETVASAKQVLEQWYQENGLVF